MPQVAAADQGSDQRTSPRYPKPSGLNLRHTVWDRIARERGLDPYLLYAVALTESARVTHGYAMPWPWAIQQAGRSRYLASRGEAEQHLRGMPPRASVDVGLMQVNLRWHGDRVRQVGELMDPLTNLRIGADILCEALASVPGDRVLGVGRYHAWHNRQAAYRYGRRVLALAARLKSRSIG